MLSLFQIESERQTQKKAEVNKEIVELRMCKVRTQENPENDRDRER